MLLLVRNTYFLESKELPVEDLIAQCYDGAPNMQSKKKGAVSFKLKKIIWRKSHCSLHDLNLASAKAAKIQIIDNTLKQLKAIQIFFSTSPKSDHLLEYIVKLRYNTSSKKICVTWNVQEQVVWVK